MWQPNADGLAQLVEVLRNANSPNTQVQLEVHQKLLAFAKIPDYNNYLMFIQTKMPNESETVRAVAGLILKNNIRTLEHVPLPSIQYIQQCCLDSIADASPLVRSTVGTIMTTILQKIGVRSWPEALPRLMALVGGSDPSAAEGSISALQKICEDSTSELENAPDAPLQHMIPRFIQLTESPSAKIRSCALSCLNQFIAIQSNYLFNNLDPYVMALSKCAMDQEGAVRKLVCNAFVMLLDVRPDIVMNQAESICSFMLHATEDADENVALEACEFWLTFAEKEDLQNCMKPLLPRLLPVLLKTMVYTETDALILTGGDEATTGENIKPRHHKAKTHSLDHLKDQENEGEDGAADDGSDDEDDDEDDEAYAEWNLRKCSAATLDVVSTVFGSEILPIILPVLNERLFSAEWRHRESAILALGAVAEGCMTGVQPHLNQLVPFLFQSLSDPQPLIRSITCWTLSRYCRWCAYPTDGTTDKNQYFTPLVLGTLERMLDPHKKVQEASCSALATLEEELGDDLVPYLDKIVPCIVTAFGRYQKKNLMILYDALTTLAESVEGALNNPSYVGILMPALIEKWNALPDDDDDLFPLFECLSSVAVALQAGFLPFAQPITERCLRIIQQTVTADLAHQQNAAIEEPNKDFLIVALDLLSGLIQGLGAQAEPLIVQSNPPLIEILAHCVKDPLPEIRQSSFALVGDIAIASIGYLKPHLAALLPTLIEHVDPVASVSHFAVCNNACWAIGEIAVRCPELAVYAETLCGKLIPLLNHTEISRTLRENAAITLGRLGLVAPEKIAPHLPAFSENWCKTLRHTQDNEEKETAFLGFCQLIQRNPNGIGHVFPIFCDSLCQWSNPSPQLRETFKSVLHGFKTMLADQWPQYYNTFPNNLRQKLAQKYQL